MLMVGGERQQQMYLVQNDLLYCALKKFLLSSIIIQCEIPHVIKQQSRSRQRHFHRMGLSKEGFWLLK